MMQTQRNTYLLPLILVTSLFFLWGLAYGLLDVLNKHFQETLNITRQKSTLLQAAYFGAYFLVALPAGLFMNKAGYKKGIIVGLLLYATGALLFYPSASMASFPFFLLSLFILASGLTFLETAANPYITVLGDPKTSEFRLNLSQSFNGVGSFIGPILGGMLFFGNKALTSTDNLGSVKLVYIAIAAIVLFVALLFVRTPLPEIKEEQLVDSKMGPHGTIKDQIPTRPSYQGQTGSAPVGSGDSALWKKTHFSGAVIAQFFYVAAQVGIAALFINYCTEQGVGIDSEKAAYLLSISLMLFTFGRFAGTAIMRAIAPNKLLAVYGLINILLCLLVIFNKGILSVYALMAIFFFESIMFPTIFALGVKNLGSDTKRASSFIIMSIVGGALMPFVMGWVADHYSTAASYGIPLLCFVVVVWYGWRGFRVNN